MHALQGSFVQPPASDLALATQSIAGIQAIAEFLELDWRSLQNLARVSHTWRSVFCEQLVSVRATVNRRLLRLRELHAQSDSAAAFKLERASVANSLSRRDTHEVVALGKPPPLMVQNICCMAHLLATTDIFRKGDRTGYTGPPRSFLPETTDGGGAAQWMDHRAFKMAAGDGVKDLGNCLSNEAASIFDLRPSRIEAVAAYQHEPFLDATVMRKKALACGAMCTWYAALLGEWAVVKSLEPDAWQLLEVEWEVADAKVAAQEAARAAEKAKAEAEAEAKAAAAVAAAGQAKAGVKKMAKEKVRMAMEEADEAEAEVEAAAVLVHGQVEARARVVLAGRQAAGPRGVDGNARTRRIDPRTRRLPLPAVASASAAEPMNEAPKAASLVVRGVGR